MDRLDKFLTNWKWSIIILGLLFVYFCTNGDVKLKVLSAFIVVFCCTMIIWALIVTSNKVVRGKIHWKHGGITYTGYFDRYYEFEQWKTQTLISQGHLIYSIDEEEKQQVPEGDL